MNNPNYLQICKQTFPKSTRARAESVNGNSSVEKYQPTITKAFNLNENEVINTKN